MRRALVILVLILATLALALWGQYRADPAAFIADPTRHLYQGIQLFWVAGDWTLELERSPVAVDVARFVAPFVTLTSLVLLFVRGAWVGLTNLRAGFSRGHIVLVGLNELAWHFARSCRRIGIRVVAVDRDEQNPHVERCRAMGVPVIVGDALTGNALQRAGIARADHVVTFVRNDGVNVELTLRVKALGRRSFGDRSAPIRVRCHLADVQLANRLEEYPKFFLDAHLAEVSFFNAHGLAARTLLKQQPLEVFADALRRGVHVVILGDTALAEQVMLQVARTAHYADMQPPRITWLVGNEESCRSRVERAYPGLQNAARLSVLEMAISADAFEVSPQTTDFPVPVTDATAYVVCVENDSEALGIALALRRATLLSRGLNAPVMVAMARSDGLARLLESELGTPEIPDGLYPFGMLDEIVSAENIVDERLDRLAQAFHENYLEGLDKGASKPRRSQVPWRLLPEVYRNGNRLAADHLDAKLRAVGCREVELPAPPSGERPRFQFEPRELERLARMEHNRFVAVRYAAGWRAGEGRSEFARIDQLEPWERLDDAARSYDIRAAREIPMILVRRVRHAVVREVVIGATGHRPHRLTNHTPHAARTRDPLTVAVERTLDHVAALYAGATFTVLSSLAEGADRLLAELAMRRLAARLYVPLPLPYDLYVEDFGDTSDLDREQSLDEFHALLGQAERYFELPLAFGSLPELEARTDEGSRARARQYALAGAYVVQRSHELIAVWDGFAHEGEGGTAQIVQWRRQGVPDAYRFPDRFFPPVEQKGTFIVPPDAQADYRPERLE